MSDDITIVLESTDEIINITIDDSVYAITNWGGIYGELADQTDLQAALDAKVDDSEVATVATANKLLKLNGSGLLPASITGNAATATEVDWSGVSAKPSTYPPSSHATGSHSDWPATVSMVEVGYLDGVRSGIQAQLDSKASSSDSVTNGNMHDHSGGDGAQIDHANLANIGTSTHANIDAALNRLANTSGANTGDQDLSGLVPKTTTINNKPLSGSVLLAAGDVGADPAGSAAAVQAGLSAHAAKQDNPHGVTAQQVGLGSVDNVRQMPLSYLDTDVALASNSDAKVSSQRAVKTYVDQLISAANAMVYRGPLDCSTNPDYPAGDAGHVWLVSAAGTVGGAGGVAVESGDMLVCATNATASGDQVEVGEHWHAIQKNIADYLIGPSTSTDGNFPLYDGVTGKLLKNSAYSPASFEASGAASTAVAAHAGSATAHAAATTEANGFMSSSDKAKLDGMATGANNYVLPTATATVKGGVELLSDTVQPVAANAVSETASRTYGVQLNSDGQAVVNVPWIDTNTTYSNGTGLDLSGTSFSVKYGAAAGTACQGNDSRLSDARPPVAHTHNYLPLTGGDLSGNVLGQRFTGVGFGNDFASGAFEARGNGPTNTVFPSYGFHQEMAFAGSLQMRGDGDFRFYKQGATEYANVTANLFIGSAKSLYTTRANWKTNGTGSAVVGQLGWSNYGDVHTIIDASSGLSPEGAVIPRTDAQNDWSIHYPVLVGWNGAQTYGVRVASAKVADTVGGRTIYSSTANPSGGVDGDIWLQYT